MMNSEQDRHLAYWMFKHANGVAVPFVLDRFAEMVKDAGQHDSTEGLLCGDDVLLVLAGKIASTRATVIVMLKDGDYVLIDNVRQEREKDSGIITGQFERSKSLVNLVTKVMSSSTCKFLGVPKKASKRKWSAKEKLALQDANLSSFAFRYATTKLGSKDRKVALMRRLFPHDEGGKRRHVVDLSCMYDVTNEEIDKLLLKLGESVQAKQVTDLILSNNRRLTNLEFVKRTYPMLTTIGVYYCDALTDGCFGMSGLPPSCTTLEIHECAQVTGRIFKYINASLPLLDKLVLQGQRTVFQTKYEEPTLTIKEWRDNMVVRKDALHTFLCDSGNLTRDFMEQLFRVYPSISRMFVHQEVFEDVRKGNVSGNPFIENGEAKSSSVVSFFTVDALNNDTIKGTQACVKLAKPLTFTNLLRDRTPAQLSSTMLEKIQRDLPEDDVHERARVDEMIAKAREREDAHADRFSHGFTRVAQT